jgi:hypothetical protein
MDRGISLTGGATMPSTLTAFPKRRRQGSSKLAAPQGGFLTGTALADADFVTIDANGRVTLAVAAGNNVGAATKLALSNQTRASGDATGTKHWIEYFDDEAYVILPVTTGGGTVNSNVNNVGKQYELRNQGGIWCVDVGANTNVKVEIVAWHDTNTYPIGTAFAPAICKIVAAARIAG